MSGTGLRQRPSRDEIAQLPPFVGLAPERIEVLATAAQFAAARRAIEDERVIGFDTESKPTFVRGAVQDGPHVIQFALRDRAFIVQLGAHPPLDFLKAIIASDTIVKVGFGLKSDHGPLQRKLGFGLRAALELSQQLRVLGYRQELGAKAAVAIVLGQRLQKAKSVTTSNWALARLSPSQLRYAANDAFAALSIFHAMAAQYPDTGSAPPGGPGLRRGNPTPPP